MKIKDFPHRQQLNIKDCGATCLQLIAEFYGKKYSLQTLREYSCISREGSSLMGLSDAAERIGFHTLGLCLGYDKLIKDVKLPCILFWNNNHYVICYKIKRRRNGCEFYISDPASMKYTCNESDFKKHWINTVRNNEERGIVLSLVPDTTFYEYEDEGTLGRSHDITRYIKYITPHKGGIAQNIICLIIYMILGLATPFLTQSVVDVGIKGGNLDFVILILIAQLILALTSMGIGLINSWVSIHMTTRINISLIADFWSKLLKLPAKFYDINVTGDIMQRFGDHGRIQDFLLHSTIKIAFSAVNFVIYTAILAYYNTKILAIFFAGQFLYVLWTLCFLKQWKKLDYQNFEISAKNKNKTLQMLQGVVDIKLSNEERQKRWEWEKIQAKQFRLSLKSLKLGQLQNNVGSLITNITYILLSYIVAKNVIDGEMTLGMMMAITYITGQIGGPVNDFVGFIQSLQYTKISLERLNEINDSEDDDTEIQTKRTDMPDNQSLHFDHVSYSYDGSSRRYVLKDVSFVIPEKKVTAIVGSSGCGKTTIMKLLQGLYAPTEGIVSVDNTPIVQMNPHLWRKHIGAVMQDGYIFSDTIARNIATGDLEIDKERLRYAARIANINDFINKNPLGYNMKIGMEGTGISQGQRQRVLIARATYKNPDIFLFDEATNALDSKNEKEIMNNLSECFKGKTVVIAAHRLSTIRNADQIIVMRDGAVAEIGNHESLMKNKGAYYELVESQL